MITTTYTCDLKECGTSVAVDSNNEKNEQPEGWEVTQHNYMEGYYVSCCQDHLEAIVRERISGLKRGDPCVVENGYIGQFIDSKRGMVLHSRIEILGCISRPIGLLNEEGKDLIKRCVSGPSTLFGPLPLDRLDLIVQKLDLEYEPGSPEEKFMAEVYPFMGEVYSLKGHPKKIPHSEIKSYLSILESFDFNQIKVSDLNTLVRFNRALRDSSESIDLGPDQRNKTAKRIYRIFDRISNLYFGNNYTLAFAVGESRQNKSLMNIYYNQIFRTGNN